MRIIKQSSNQKCMTQPTLTNLHCNKYSQEFHYYPFAVKLNRCVGSFNDLPNKVWISNKTEDLNVIINVIQINGGITMNVVLSIKTSHMWKGYYEKYYENGE